MDEMVIIGMDPHKASNTIAVLDSTENLLTRRRFENSDDGFVEMLAAVGEYRNRVWAVEGANGMGRSIAQRLVGFDEREIGQLTISLDPCLTMAPRSDAR